MKKTILFIFFTLVLGSAYGQKINQIQEIAIRDSIDNVLKALQECASFTEDGEKISDKMIQAFIDLHATGYVIVFNDLKPGKSRNNLIMLNQYVSYAETNYPSGFNVSISYKLESITKPLKLADNRFSVFIPLTKTLTGLFQNKKIVTNTGIIYYEIVFQVIAEEVTNFKIAGVHKEATVRSIQSNAKQKGVHIGLAFSGGSTAVGASGKDWDITPQIGFGYGLEVNYFSSSSFAFTVGVLYSGYSSQYTLADYTDDYTKVSTYRTKETDLDNESFYRLITAKIEDAGSISALDIPVGLMFRLGRADKFGFYLKPTLVTSLILGGTSTVTGTSEHKGYYPEYPVILDNLEEYQFTKVDYNNSYDWTLGKTAFSAQIGAGFSIPVGAKMFVNIGGIYQMGLTDIGYTTAKYRDDFISIGGDAKTMKLNKVGGALTFTYKL